MEVLKNQQKTQNSDVQKINNYKKIPNFNILKKN